jgi:glycosyltransferase involved in cell wall biosynthesis
MIINKVSIVVPCFNEISTIEKLLKEIQKVRNLNFEIVVVDDGSTDGTKEFLMNIKDENIKTYFHEKNYGKGKALRTGFENSIGDILIIQDADLEYSPTDYPALLKPFTEADADVVYGSRFLGGQGYTRLHYFFHYLANKLLTFTSNIFTNLNMSDMETGFKVFKKSAIDSIKLYEDSFGIEPEITIKLAKKNFKFYEVAVSYRGRSYEEGKKITIKDAFRALYCIVKYSIFR